MPSSSSDKTAAEQQSLPQHIAVVMDGNGRWATSRLLPRSAGHKAGVKATRNMVEHCALRGIKVLTLFAFSSENWNRPEKEVSGLMSLFLTTLGREINKLHRKGVRIRFIGDRSRFHASLQDEIDKAEKLTAANSGLKLNIAANYGGRWDIVQAARQMASRHADGDLGLEEITESRFTATLCLAGQPEPDLMIRTGGEQRISNFLLWQLAYAELYFTDILWPDFDDTALEQAIDWYARRQRRFGRTGEQVEKNPRKVS